MDKKIELMSATQAKKQTLEIGFEKLISKVNKLIKETSLQGEDSFIFDYSPNPYFKVGVNEENIKNLISLLQVKGYTVKYLDMNESDEDLKDFALYPEQHETPMYPTSLLISW